MPRIRLAILHNLMWSRPAILPSLLMLLPCPTAAQDFELRRVNDSLYYLNDWRLPYPVYQFQTGDIDGDGSPDAMVGVVKPTRFYPEKARRLFIFKQINGKARPMWLGSKLGGVLQDFRFVDGRIRSLEATDGRTSPEATEARIRSLETTTDSLYVVAEYRWSGFGMAFDRFLVRGTDRATALEHFNQ